jgi:menaquinol-cytochrome c reductase iron-sulfur subunit
MPKEYRSPVLDRRNFVKIVTSALGSVMAALVGLPVIQYFISPALGQDGGDEWVSLGPLENYPFGTPTLFNFTLTQVNGWERSSQSYGVFVLREEGKDVVVFSDVCTHLSCRVNWDNEQGEFQCPCHAAFFDKYGSVVTGPPPRPLDRFEIKLEEGQLFIHLREG